MTDIHDIADPVPVFVVSLVDVLIGVLFVLGVAGICCVMYRMVHRRRMRSMVKKQPVQLTPQQMLAKARDYFQANQQTSVLAGMQLLAQALSCMWQNLAKEELPGLTIRQWLDHPPIRDAIAKHRWQADLTSFYNQHDQVVFAGNTISREECLAMHKLIERIVKTLNS